MTGKHTISNQKRDTNIGYNDLFLISKTLNEPYNTQWQSIAATAKSVSHCFADMIAKDEYKDKFDTLNDIYCSYLNNDNLTLVYNKNVDSNKYYLALSSEYADTTFGEIEVNDFVIAGMLNNAEISAIGEKKYLVLAFNTVNGEKKISVDMTDFIDVYNFKDGLTAENNCVSVDYDKVAKKEHVHAMSDILSTTYQKADVIDGNIPASIEFNVDIPIQIYSNNLSLLHFKSFSSDASEDGVYTWELMVNSDVDMNAPTFGANITYVGKDKDTLADSMKLIDNSPTIHVFSVRLIKVPENDYWQMNYCYSFKK